MNDLNVARLREWGESLEREYKGCIGETLLKYAEAWERQLSEANANHEAAIEEWKAAMREIEAMRPVVEAAQKELAEKTKERDEARFNARILANSYLHDSRPPRGMVDQSLAYPMDQRKQP